MHRNNSVKWRRIVGFVVAGCIIAIFAFGIFWSLRFMRVTGMTPGVVFQLLTKSGMTLKSSRERTNVLLLGAGGGNHEGADLTDTMMVLSINAQKKSVALISIPRDTWSDTLKDKVNSAYHYGELKKQGGGMVLTKVVVEDVIGMPIHYGLFLDFSGFKKIIDLLGGVDVQVAQAFTDNNYPIAGKEQDTCPGDPTNRCVYETIHFDSGLQHMNGEVALKYVRSRHADGQEGSDFARSRRQQDIIIALKNKIVHPTVWFTLDRMKQLSQVLDDATDTDMNFGELATVGKWFIQEKDSSIVRVVFDEFLVEPPPYLFGGRYTLVPVESWKQVHEALQAKLDCPTCKESGSQK